MIDTYSIPLYGDVISFNDGIFRHIPYTFKDIASAELDLLMETNYGQRRVTPLIMKFLSSDNKLTSDDMDTIGTALWTLYNAKWNRDMSALEQKYNILDTFSIEQTDNRTKKDTSTDNTTNDLSTHNTSSKENTFKSTTGNESTETSKNTVSQKGSETTSKSSFDTTVMQDTDKVSSTADNTDNTTNTGTTTGTNSSTNSDTGNTTITNTGTVKNAKDLNSIETFTSASHGNTAGKTNQDLIFQEIKLAEWNLVENILLDVSKYLTIPLYF